MQNYNFKKYKVKVYELVLEFFHTHYGSWDMMDFPNIDEFVHNAWAKNLQPDRDTVNLLLTSQFTLDEGYVKSEAKPTMLDPGKHRIYLEEETKAKGWFNDWFWNFDNCLKL